jgi:hypothetical protein
MNVCDDPRQRSRDFNLGTSGAWDDDCGDRDRPPVIGQLDGLDFIKVNGVKATDGEIKVLSFNGNTSTIVIDSGKFDPSWGAGIYNLQYSTSQMGCEKVTDFMVFVNDTPDLQILGVRGFCSTYSWPFDLKGIQTFTSKGVTNILYPEGQFFTPNIDVNDKYIGGNYTRLLIGENQFHNQYGYSCFNQLNSSE